MVKRYVREDRSGDVAKWLRAGTPATARLTWVEIVSAVARRMRQGDVTPARFARVNSAVEEDSRRILTIQFTEAVDESARRLIASHPLRAGDAIQLASALSLADRSGRPIVFVAFDAALAAAARAEGLKTLGV